MVNRLSNNNPIETCSWGLRYFLETKRSAVGVFAARCYKTYISAVYGVVRLSRPYELRQNARHVADLTIQNNVTEDSVLRPAYIDRCGSCKESLTPQLDWYSAGANTTAFPLRCVISFTGCQSTNVSSLYCVWLCSSVLTTWRQSRPTSVITASQSLPVLDVATSVRLHVVTLLSHRQEQPITVRAVLPWHGGRSTAWNSLPASLHDNTHT